MKPRLAVPPVVLLAVLAAPDAGTEEKPARKPNRLAAEKSPYLLQHAHNPVDWYPWGEEAFARARREEKPIFLSIGYSTCHWCHVMERESFEDAEIAEYLNANFVAIKVDREERPDVDAVYMEFVMRSTGSGGWPLSAFLTPDGKPFFGGTYFPPRDDPARGSGFLTLLGQIRKVWHEDRDRILKSAGEIQEFLARENARVASEGAALEPEVLAVAYRAFREEYDEAHGGFEGPPRHAPKFPRTVTLDFLLRYAAWPAPAGNEALRMVTGTLDAMARGGIRDHLAGGFHRYSTDREWLVPHFEKMLYDQALIARTLADAYRVTGSGLYRDLARETLDYVLSRMTGPDGEIYSAEDADTQGVEGKTYTWTMTEVLAILGKERGEHFAELYGITAEGNFAEGGAGANILHLAFPDGAAGLARKYGISLAGLEQDLREDRLKLLAARDRRPQPLRDDKVLAEWNGLAISALAQVHQATGDEKYLEAARRSAVFIRSRMMKEGKLYRRFRQGDVAVEGFLEDHAFVIEGFLDLYESSFEAEWLAEAVRLGKELLHLFRDEKDGAFFSSGRRHEALIVRGKEFYDGAVPSGNSVALLDLLRLAEFTQDAAFRDAAQSLERAAAAVLARSPGSYPRLLCGVHYRLHGPREIVIAGAAGDPVAQAFRREVHARFLPSRILVSVRSAEEAKKLAPLVPLAEGKEPSEGKATAFVCRKMVCRLPSRDLEAFRKELEAGAAGPQ